MSVQTILVLMCVLVGASALFELLLDCLNLRQYRRDRPPELVEFYTPEAYVQARSYHRSTTTLGMVQVLVSAALTLFVLLAGLPGWLDQALGNLGLAGLPLTLAFFASAALISGAAGLPFNLIRTFGIEARHGFNRTTPATWLADLVKGTILGGLVGGLLLSALVLLVQALGPGFWLVFFVVAMGFSLVMNLLYTSLILPLFNKLVPLEPGELKSAIQEYAQANGFPLEAILVMDGSRRSTKANAFFSGLGRRKNIVLFDTLIQKHSVGELVAVLAHEVGHYRRKHVLWGLGLGALQTLLLLWVLSLMINDPQLSLALGGSGPRIHLGLLGFALLASPLSGLGGLLALVASRRHEFQADAWAARTSSAGQLAAALKKLATDNLGNLQPHPLYVFFNYSHPPLLSRLAALKNQGPAGPAGE